MSHDNQHSHEHDRPIQEYDSGKLERDAHLAAKINLLSGVAKTALGFIASSPVLVTDGVHDFGDADTYREDANGIAETDPVLKAKRKIRAATKLGSYAVAGTIAETIVDQTVMHAPIPIISLTGGVASLVLNQWVHKRFSHHTHEDADEVKGHARIDLVASGVTIGASALAFAWTPFLLIGSVVHIGLYSWQGLKTYKKFKDQARGIPA